MVWSFLFLCFGEDRLSYAAITNSSPESQWHNMKEGLSLIQGTYSTQVVRDLCLLFVVIQGPKLIKLHHHVTFLGKRN